MLSFIVGATAIVNPTVGLPVAATLAATRAALRCARRDRTPAGSTAPAAATGGNGGGHGAAPGGDGDGSGASDPLTGGSVAAVTLEWSNLQCTLTDKHGKRRVLLDRVSGTARPGRLLGIMGPSGSGKTTLLNALAGHVSRVKGLRLRGTLTLNGAPAPMTRRGQAYVVQEDLHYSMCTVQETLDMATQLRLPPAVPEPERVAAAERVVQVLGLSKAAATRVGDKKTRGLSGGEKKRLSIGCELVGSPSLIFLDEPTTGLDSAQAQQVMSTLKELALAGHTVVCSIHQPRSSIFAMLDDLLLLSDGMALYSGPADQVGAYFSSVDSRYKCPPNFNPADFASDLSSRDFTSPEAELESGQRLQKLAKAWRRHTRHQAAAAKAAVALAEGAADGQLQPAIGVVRQFRLLLVRSWRQVTRDKATHVARAMSNVSSALIFSAIFWRMRRSQATIQDRLGLLQGWGGSAPTRTKSPIAVAAINTAMASLMKTLAVFPRERAIVDRERAAGAYKVAPYLGAKLMAELPIGALFPLLFGAIVYPATGLNPSVPRFLRFLGILTVESFASSALGLAVGSFAPSPEAATAIGPAVMVLFIVFGGFYKTTPVGGPLRWLPHASLIKHGFQALCVNEFKGAQFSPDETVGGAGGAGGLQSGQQVLQWLAFHKGTVGSSLVAQLRIVAFYYYTTFCILRARQPHFAAVEAPPLEWEADDEEAAVAAEGGDGGGSAAAEVSDPPVSPKNGGGAAAAAAAAPDASAAGAATSPPQPARSSQRSGSSSSNGASLGVHSLDSSEPEQMAQ